MNTLFTGFEYKYPDDFIEQLEKILGVKFTRCKFETVPADSVDVKPLPAPNATLYYLDVKYKKHI